METHKPAKRQTHKTTVTSHFFRLVSCLFLTAHAATNFSDFVLVPLDAFTTVSSNKDIPL